MVSRNPYKERADVFASFGRVGPARSRYPTAISATKVWAPARRRSSRRGTVTATDRIARLAKLERMAEALDSKFRLPVLGVPVGWDSILGVIPGLGDLVTVGPGAWMILEGHRMGARKRILGRMALNTTIDTALGSIPLLGDAFDLFFKSHRRNVSLLRREIKDQPALEARVPASKQV